MGAYIWPVPSAMTVSSQFGYRVAPTPGASNNHLGIDIPAANGAAILSTRAGKVTTVAFNSSRGNYLVIDHGDNIVSWYQHCSRVLVSKGDQVSAGQRVALVGSTGVSTGNHLHFELWIGKKAVNPLSYMKPGDTKEKFTGNAGTSSSGKKKAVLPTGNTVAQAIQTAVAETAKDITTVSTKSITGEPGEHKNALAGLPAFEEYGVEILIQNDKIYAPVVLEDIRLEHSRKGAASKLTFSVLKDSVLNIQEGNPVTMRVNGEPVFAGYLFKKSRKDPDTIDLTCYDQLRYLKNKDTISYENMTYGEVVAMIAKDNGLACGTLADTGYKIPSRLEEGTLLDILQNASDLTIINTGSMYIFYDDFGKLTLKPLRDMVLDVVLDADTAEGYSYESGIDSDTYNRVKLAIDNGDTGEREVFVTNDTENQGKWGILTLYEKLDSEADSTALSTKANALLGYYNRKHRKLQITGAFGDIRVRGGSLLPVFLSLGDITVQNYMMVEKVTHRFCNGSHSMDLTMVNTEEGRAGSGTTVLSDSSVGSYTKKYSAADATMMAKVMYKEARGIQSRTEIACVGWTILNRVDAGYGSIQAVITAPNQFAYSSSAKTVSDYGYDLVALATDVCDRWSREKAGQGDVGRVLPKGYLWYSGYGGHNHFRNAFSGGTQWNYSLPSPYEN